MNPQPNFNLTTEFKNVKNSRKADGAILDKDEAIAVIELKGTKTKDLESIRQQAFDYKANQPGCVYVITSNFEKLRFYINNAVDFEEFDLFMLSYERFEMLYLCLHKNNLLQHLPLKIKEASLHEEEDITKKFYSDYSNFKRELFRDMVKRNLRNPALKELGESSSKKELFKKTQKLLDRFLFIFFGEDRGLLPPNSIPKILEQWESLKKMDAYSALYERYKKYFGYLNEGWKGQDHEIFAYNGGLFKPDPILDTIEIDDELLFKHTSILTKYDFESQVDVNILGHIFEHSLNEIESVNAEIDGVEFDKQKTKRKKDGVFYTPKYITKYIVDNTVGKLCEEKKAELDIREEEYLKGPKNRAKTTIQKLDGQLEAYRAWLLTLTICDPACGSGAFLNQALDFLILEHRWIDEMSSKLHGGGFVFPDIENSILEKNIYGVDLNDESVEIAKLSLWLRTAQKGRKLTSLNSNIKCGNSLIDSKAVAGDKAFSWEKEFPEVFAKGGFDVIIGNPPYVRQELFKEIKPYLEQNYKCFNSVADLYTYFIEKGIRLMNDKGLFSFILPNKFLKASYGKEIRKVMKEEANLQLLFDFDDYPVFSDATTYPIIYILNKKQKNQDDTFMFSAISKRENTLDPINSLELKKYKVLLNSLNEIEWSFEPIEVQVILKKIKDETISLSKFVSKGINRGVLTGKNEVFIFNKKLRDDLLSKGASKELIKPILLGSAIKRYHIDYTDDYILFTRRGIDIDNYPVIKDYLKPFYEVLKPRNNGEAIGRKAGPYKWFEIQDNIAYYKDFDKTKIVYPRTNSQCNFQLDTTGYFLSDNNFYINSSSKTLLGILNSKLIFFYLKSICTTLQGGYYDFRRDKVDTIPIKQNFEENELIEALVSKQIELHKSDSSIKKSFLNYIQSNFNLDKFSRKLESWHDLDFSDFIKELNKAIKKSGGNPLSKLDEMEWMEVFETKKKEALELKAEIDKTDREIDGMVYELYGLTEEEIKIVENS